MSQKLPTPNLSDGNPTRDTLHQYARIIGKIRGRYMPKSKHWWHITLSNWVDAAFKTNPKRAPSECLPWNRIWKQQ
jgi:hypothetical protein